ncbi:MAG: hypothetical protein AAFV85_13330 [Cyanobacteria bacterium J06634_6]
MVSGPKAQLIVQFNDPVLDEEECDREYLRLIHELKNNPAIDAIHRIPLATRSEVPAQPSKSALAFVKNLLTAEINGDNLKPAIRSLYARLVRKTIELEVEANGRRLKVTVSSQEDLEVAIQNAQRFVDQAPISQESVK